MTMGDVVDLRNEPPEWIIGPFEVNRVMIDGRVIPGMAASRESDGRITLLLDNRFALTVPADLAFQVAHFAATAIAIGAGYSHIGGESRDRPFAPMGAQLGKIV